MTDKPTINGALWWATWSNPCGHQKLSPNNGPQHAIVVKPRIPHEYLDFWRPCGTPD